MAKGDRRALARVSVTARRAASSALVAATPSIVDARVRNVVVPVDEEAGGPTGGRVAATTSGCSIWIRCVVTGEGAAGCVVVAGATSVGGWMAASGSSAAGMMTVLSSASS
jgi:hypothetical protein